MDVSRVFCGADVVVPVRMLSSSALKRIQSCTSSTKCGVLSLKKSGERKSRSAGCDMGNDVNSITIAVIFESGATTSYRDLGTLFGGNNAPMLEDDARRIRLYEMFNRRNGVASRRWSLNGWTYALFRSKNISRLMNKLNPPRLANTSQRHSSYPQLYNAQASPNSPIPKKRIAGYQRFIMWV